VNSIERNLHASPVLVVRALDEHAAIEAVEGAARAVLGPDHAVFVWDAAHGLTPSAVDVASLDEALDIVAAADEASLLLVLDAVETLRSAATRRRLRELGRRVGTRPVRVVLIVPPGELPHSLARALPVVDQPMPSMAALRELVAEEAGELVQRAVGRAAVAGALNGLTTEEARLALRRCRATATSGAELAGALFAEKAERSAGPTLQFVPPETALTDVGGLGALKDWADERAALLLSDDSMDSGVVRGILLTGVSGCGKSHAIKALSRCFGVPLFRLDMARVFAHPQPEAAFAATLTALDALAPCVLWIDELENAFALGAQDTGSAARISGSFLTWLQERRTAVFVGATANRIELLPAELLRRGRFDQIFFVDLPNVEERKEVWAIQLRRIGADPARFDLIVLASSTDGWSGAEIETAVRSANLQAIAAERSLDRDGLLRAIGRTIPLSVTMQEQIKRVREWAHERALSASRRPVT